MLGPRLRARLEELNRQPFTADEAGSAEAVADATSEPSFHEYGTHEAHTLLPPLSPPPVSATVVSFKWGQQAATAIRSTRRLIGPGEASAAKVERLPIPLESLGGAPQESASSVCWTIRTPVGEFGSNTAAALEAPRGPIEEIRSRSGRAIRHYEEMTGLARGLPHETLFLDLETCGFAGSVVFLAGVVCCHEGQAVVEQYLARNYDEERAVLELLWRKAAEHSLLVTFNGKSFDWPMVHERSNYHNLGRDPKQRRRRAKQAGQTVTTEQIVSAETLGPRDPRPAPFHVDLLHHARRRWRRQLPNCRLQTLEQFLCRRVREGDIAGRDIPAAYHRFVRTADASQLADIVRHNALDLVTLVELACHLCADVTNAGR